VVLLFYSVTSGQIWTEANVRAAIAALMSLDCSALDNSDETPGGQTHYRKTLAASFLLRAFFKVTHDLSERVADVLRFETRTDLPMVPEVISENLSAADSFVTMEAPVSHGQQVHTNRCIFVLMHLTTGSIESEMQPLLSNTCCS
jgi:hypothetical protein